MKYLKIIFQILEIIVAAWKYAGGEITKAQYNKVTRKLGESLKKAQSSDPNEVMDGVSEIEDALSGRDR